LALKCSSEIATRDVGLLSRATGMFGIDSFTVRRTKPRTTRRKGRSRFCRGR
jgi:hypothetical protein